MKLNCFVFLLLFVLVSCDDSKKSEPEGAQMSMENNDTYVITRDSYKDKLEGFWLGSCIANWTGLVTEMDKIGNIGDIKTGEFYTRENWGKPDQPSIWSEDPSDILPTIDFVFREEGEMWGADDDTDIEYMYQYLLWKNETVFLTPEQIRDGWLKHILSEEENYLWVSNQRAFDLMQKGVLPPETSEPSRNEHYDMIDAQLTTEMFGLLAPGHPDMARKMAFLPIHTTAAKEAADIAQFYVTMYGLATVIDSTNNIKDNILAMAAEARQILPDSAYPAKMYDFVVAKYQSGIPWEQARDSIYIKYQVEQQDGYDITSRDLYCNGCFAAGINFAASLVSLFYGEGDLKETIKIGSLAGWDADNPTATWGGMLGFMLGKERIEKEFDRTLSDQFHIHRTRQNFPNEGIDDFGSMADKGIAVIDRVVSEEMGGQVDTFENVWIIPKH